MIEPFCAGTMWRSAALQHRYTDLRLMSCTRSARPAARWSRSRSSSGGRDARVVERDVDRAVGLDGGVEQSCRPRPRRRRRPARTVRSSSSATVLPVVGSMSPMTIVAPSARIRLAVGQPDAAGAAGDDGDLARQSLGQVHLSCLSFDRKEDVLGFREVQWRIRPELAAEPGLLESAERRVVAHRRVRVHRQVAGFDRRATPASPATFSVQIEPDRP